VEFALHWAAVVMEIWAVACVCEGAAVGAAPVLPGRIRPTIHPTAGSSASTRRYGARHRATGGSRTKAFPGFPGAAAASSPCSLSIEGLGARLQVQRAHGSQIITAGIALGAEQTMGFRLAKPIDDEFAIRINSRAATTCTLVGLHCGRQELHGADVVDLKFAHDLLEEQSLFFLKVRRGWRKPRDGMADRLRLGPGG
jgi:hypothetical protein